MNKCIRHILALLFVAAVQPLWASTGDSITPPAGHAIGSAGFNDMLGKQIQPGTFAVQPQADGSFVLENRMQTVAAHITPQGTQFDSIGNSAGKGGFGLALTQFGREGDLQAVGSSRIYRDGDAVIHTHTNGIAEKFSNTSGGIRQDFIVPVKPQGIGELHVKLQVNGASVVQKNDGAIIQLASGRQLTYDRLLVTDSANQAIPARIEIASGNMLEVVVDDARAKYPLTIDPTVGDENWVSMGGVLPGTDGAVSVVVTRGDNVYIGGAFKTSGGLPNTKGIAMWDGVSWKALGTGISNGSNVSALTFDPAGNLYVAGSFNSIGGLLVGNIAKWDGLAWNALGTGVGGGKINALASDTAGNIYATGDFTSAGGAAASRIARWDGTTWSALGSGLDGAGNALATNGSSLFVGGGFTSAGGISANYIARWDGFTWSVPSSGMNKLVRTLAFDSSGNLYAGGDFTSAGGVTVNRVAKWDGLAWSDMGVGLSQTVIFSLVVDKTNTVYVGGRFVIYGASAGIAKWSGTEWIALDSGRPNNVAVMSIAVSDTSQLYAGGDYKQIGGSNGNYVAKWNGSSWSSLGIGINANVNAVAKDLNGNIYIGGAFTNVFGQSGTSGVAKWNGTVWSALGGGVSGVVWALATDGDGNLYAGGLFASAGGLTANNIARWNGSSWVAMSSGVNGQILALTIGEDGKVYAGGSFTSAGGVAANRIAYWDGSAWYACGTGVSGTVRAIAVDAADRLYVGNNHRVDLWDGTTWTLLGLGGSSGNIISSLVLDNSDALYVGGDFTTMNYYAGGPYIPSYGISKWDGFAWSALGNGFRCNACGGNVPRVSAIVIDKYGSFPGVYAAGLFDTAGSVAANGVARWDGSTWSALGSGVRGPNGLMYDYPNLYNVSALTLDDQGQLFIGGQFLFAGSSVSAFLAKWISDADSDGVENSYDAFPTNAAATTDADHDGLPDFWWQNNPYGCSPVAATCNGLTLDTTPPPLSINAGYSGSSIKEGAYVQ